VLALGLFSAPAAYRFDELIAEFAHRHPEMSLRLVGRNSSLTAERVRKGELEAAVVFLPVDDYKLDVRPLFRDEILYVSAWAERTRQPATIDQLAAAPLIYYDAESADNDPVRRQLAERAQAEGVQLRPRIEVEYIDLALALVAQGIGDTYLPSAHMLMPYCPPGLSTVPFAPAMFDTFALITRRGVRLTPAMRELIADVQAHLARVAEDLDRGR
jgi:DNA-binding transcriptional LysR family regulator